MTDMIQPNRVLVCGDRNWQDGEKIYRVLEAFHKVRPIDCIIEGECRGADTHARLAGDRLGIPVLRYPANWKVHGPGAGPIRNQRMIDMAHPTFALVFHPNLGASRGTADMVERLEKAKISYVVFES